MVGTGLIGASLGIALSRKGFEVTLTDPSPTAMRLARDLGAGALAHDDDVEPDVVVVAAPPDVVGDVVLTELARWPGAVVTDVASVKGAVVARVAAAGGDLTRYVGSHPMAGRERSGAMAARADLFEGRAWVVIPGPQNRCRHALGSSTATKRVPSADLTFMTMALRPSDLVASNPLLTSDGVETALPATSMITSPLLMPVLAAAPLG